MKRIRVDYDARAKKMLEKMNKSGIIWPKPEEVVQLPETVTVEYVDKDGNYNPKATVSEKICYTLKQLNQYASNTQIIQFICTMEPNANRESYKMNVPTLVCSLVKANKLEKKLENGIMFYKLKK